MASENEDAKGKGKTHEVHAACYFRKKMNFNTSGANPVLGAKKQKAQGVLYSICPVFWILFMCPITGRPINRLHTKQYYLDCAFSSLLASYCE